MKVISVNMSQMECVKNRYATYSVRRIIILYVYHEVPTVKCRVKIGFLFSYMQVSNLGQYEKLEKHKNNIPII